MDLASGVPLLHHGTASWETFLSVHSNWMPLLKPPVTHWGRRLSWEVFCSARKVVSIILFSEKKCDVRRGRLHGSSGATYCVGTRSYGRHVMPGVSAPRLFRPNKATFCVHRKTPYNISTWFVGQKETGVLAKWDNPCIFFPPRVTIRNTLRPFLKGHILECLLRIGTVPWPVATLSVAT